MEIYDVHVNGADITEDLLAMKEAVKKMTPDEVFEASGADILADWGVECRNGENRDACMEIISNWGIYPENFGEDPEKLADEAESQRLADEMAKKEAERLKEESCDVYQSQEEYYAEILQDFGV